MTQPANKRLVTEAALTAAQSGKADASALAAETTRATTAEGTKVNTSTYTAGLAGKQALQQVNATVTANGAAVVNKHNPVDATSGARTITLPTGQAEGTQVSVEKVDASTNTVSVTGSIRGVGSTTIALTYLSESLMLRADSAGSWWPIAGHRTKASLDLQVAPISRRAFSGRGKIVFIVDDAHTTHLTVAAPKIEAVGGKMNFAIPISSLNSGGVTMVNADVTAAYNRGHQIMSHSMTHPNMTTQTAAQRQSEWDDSKTALEALTAVGAITDFVMPNNASNLTTQQEAYLRYQRVFTAQNAPTIFAQGENGLHIGRNTWSTTSHAQFLAHIRRIAVTGETYIIFCHSVVTADASSSINPTMLDEAIALASSLGVQWVRSDEALVGHQPLIDAGFESGDLSLHAVTVKSGTSVIDIVTDTPATGLSGTKSLRIVGDASGQNIVTVGAIGMMLPRPSEEWTASCRIRQDKTSGTGGGTLLVRQWDEFGNNLGDVNTTPITTTGVTAWTQVSIAFTPNKLTRTISVRAMQTAPGIVGTTWFDHIHVAPTKLGVLG